ncbi:hypothetical protein KM043_010078 [Ampulex compressa]|nr:hypothetical protein KM043_010078 [Ampulex compressa]
MPAEGSRGRKAGLEARRLALRDVRFFSYLPQNLFRPSLRPFFRETSTVFIRVKHQADFSEEDPPSPPPSSSAVDVSQVFRLVAAFTYPPPFNLDRLPRALPNTDDDDDEEEEEEEEDDDFCDDLRILRDQKPGIRL